MFNLTKLINWYLKSMSKLVLLFMIIVVASVTSIYVPYLNFLISPGVRMLIIFMTIYILFPLSTRILVGISMGVIAMASIFTFIELAFIAQVMGDLLYLLLVVIFVNYIKNFIKNRVDL